MPATYEPIATTTLGSAAAEINFTSISSAYTDLRLIYTGSPVTNGVTFGIRFNSDSTNLYSATLLRGDGTSATSTRVTTASTYYITSNSVGGSSTIPTFSALDLFSYAGSTFKTSLLTMSNDKNGSGDVIRQVGLYRSTTAISAIKLFTFSGGNEFATGTTATLYGILKA